MRKGVGDSEESKWGVKNFEGNSFEGPNCGNFLYMLNRIFLYRMKDSHINLFRNGILICFLLYIVVLTVCLLWGGKIKGFYSDSVLYSFFVASDVVNEVLNTAAGTGADIVFFKQ